MPPIFVDLDFTLSYPVFKDVERTIVSRFVFRPGAYEFLDALSKFGDLQMLTASREGWAEDALSSRKDLRSFFSRIITMEDMAGIEDKVEAIFSLAGVSDSEKLDMLGTVKPITDVGVVFDDQAYGSDVWFLKSLAVGIYNMGPDLWVRVDRFSRENPDASGLERALHRFRIRNVRWKGRNPVELSGTPGYNALTAAF